MDLLGLDVADEATGNVISSICILCSCNVRKRIKIFLGVSRKAMFYV